VGSLATVSPTVVAVVVTWNRRDLLQECLEALQRQSIPVQVVVVDNASTDGTAAMLTADHPDVETVLLTANTGGAGGFAAGMERALGLVPDLLWLLDDDTVPAQTAAAALVRCWQDYGAAASRAAPGATGPSPAVVASRVVWTDGRDHPMNTPRPKPGASRSERAAAAALGCTPVRSASFVSIMCDAEVVRRRGLPVADYFLWNDDFEYSTRLIRGGIGLLCPASVVVHKTRVFGSTDADPGERFFFEVRNKVWLFTRGRGLNPLEKVLYAASTLRRWARTFAASPDPATLRRGLREGLLAGLRSGPRSNAEVLRSAGWPPASTASQTGEGQQFSLLLSTYAGDSPAYLVEAFTSTVQAQTRRPAEVVLVQDGPVPPELSTAIQHLVAASPVPVRVAVMEHNVGLGPALDHGLSLCAHEIVARMDADDVSAPDRFEKQLPLVETGADIVGSGLLEFGESTRDVLGRRTPPTDPDEIRRVIRFRDPFNHPTVVYRRSAVVAAGGYTEMPLMEDYLLFTRMVCSGARPANLAEPLVYYRVGAGAYARRGGKRLLGSELALQRRLRRLGITTRAQYLRNVVVRGGYRLVPQTVRKAAYRALIANRGARQGR
jgi:GT2 family glycosyltransferase